MLHDTCLFAEVIVSLELKAISSGLMYEVTGPLDSLISTWYCILQRSRTSYH